MAIFLDKEAHAELARVVGERLRAARVAAGKSGQEVATALGHKSPTQVSLAETGEGRIPPLLSLIKYARLYGVSIDYFAGLLDDPTVSPVALHGETIKRNLAAIYGGAIGHCAEVMAQALDTPLVEHQVADFETAKRIVERAEELKTAHCRFKVLNPAYDDEMRGAARLDAAIESLSHQIAVLARSLKLQQDRVEQARKALKQLHEAEDVPAGVRTRREALKQAARQERSLKEDGDVIPP
jgi:transcriptional regulator with XRE-family HTH domain